MKSWVKALLISAMTFLLLIIFLPSLAKPGLNSLLPWLLQQANFDNIEVNISKVSWYQFTLEKFSFSSASHLNPTALEQLSLHALDISYSPLHLLSGQVKHIQIDQLALTFSEQEPAAIHQANLNQSVTQQSANASKDQQSAADKITLPSAKEIFSLLPMDTLSIKQLSISHPQIKINSQLNISNQELTLVSTINSRALNQALQQQLSFNNQGILSSQISSQTSQAPILMLQGEWRDQLDTQHNKSMVLSLQQSADIESWLALLNTDQRPSQLLAKTAIQVWGLELNIPKLINDPNKILQKISGQGVFQIEINDFSILPEDKNAPEILNHADLIFSAKTNFNHIDNQQQEKNWQLIVDKLDLKGTTQSLAGLTLQLQQQLQQALDIHCSLSDNIDFSCQWQGKILQKLGAENLNSQITMDVSGSFKDSPKSGSDFILRQQLDLQLQQENKRWPRLHNTSSGDIIFTAQKDSLNQGGGFWHWQLNLPFGLNGKTDYREQLPAALAKGELSHINWQLLPDWQLQGIGSELTDAKAFTLVLNNLNWIEKNKRSASKNKSFKLQQARLSCDFDWLKLQYSPQLRSNNALENLPMHCDWQANNEASQWQQWPLPAFNFSGLVQLDSLDFKQTKMRTEVKLTGLNQRLNLALHAQHDFSGMQQGAAQVYLNNLNLEWNELGLVEMMDLTQAQLLGGTLSAQGWLQWQQYQADIFDDNSIAWRWQPDIMLRVDDLAGIYNNTTAWDDVDFQMAIRRPFYQNYKLVSQISASSINPGIEVSNILARSTTTIEADLSKALVVIEEMHSDVLGGRVKVPLIRFDTSQKINSFGIEVEGLQMSQLAELEAGSGISTTGTLDGVLPIILLPEGPQVPAGTLYARPPGGLIQYQNQVASALKESDPSVSLAMQVLEDFHYDKLQTDVTYQPNGELKLGLQFQGKNPTFFDGQATHLNLNLDYNLLDLLESLRISNDIVQTLENKYQ